jgi:homoaconitate hydratase
MLCAALRADLRRLTVRVQSRKLHVANKKSKNMVEKIVARYLVDKNGNKTESDVSAGDFVAIQPKHVMTHDNTAAVIKKFTSLGSTAKIKNPRQPVFALDHNVQDKTVENLAQYKKIQQFATEHGIDFYPAGRGIGHQILCEEGYAYPGSLVVGADSHSNMYGGLGCLGTPVVRTDAAAIWATGRTWWRVPPVAKVELRGKLLPGVTGKDVIITLCGLFNKDEVLNHAIEFTGEGVDTLSVDERLTIANMTTEWGALAGLFPITSTTLNWLRNRRDLLARRLPKPHPRHNDVVFNRLLGDLEYFKADSGAFYAKELVLDLSSVRPHVSGPNDVKVMQSVEDVEKKNVKIHKAYIVSCVNSRVQDLAAAAKVVKGKKIAPGVEFYIAAASSEVEAESSERGDWQALLDAGANPLPAGCGPCIGLGTGLLKDGEVGISATNRNFKGRMGSRDAKAFLASPEVVAASALKGFIASPDYHRALYSTKVGEASHSIQVNAPQKSAEIKQLDIVQGFPKQISGEILFCHQDNLNTDGIYAGKWTYVNDMTPEKQAQVVMENYDPNFVNIAKQGDILVGGYNFGTGSSREQAATSLKYKGIALVFAGSFSETYARNAFNNGYICIEVPELVEDLKKKYGSQAPTVKTGLTAKVDFARAVLTVDGKSYAMPALGEAIQELVVVGGLEPWITQQIQQ